MRDLIYILTREASWHLPKTAMSGTRVVSCDWHALVLSWEDYVEDQEGPFTKEKSSQFDRSITLQLHRRTQNNI